MSVINSNPFGPELAAPGFQEFELGGSPGSGGYPQLPPASDTIRPGQYATITLPITGPRLGVGGCSGAPSNTGGSVQAGFGSILTQISNALSSLFAQLGAALGGSGPSAATPPPASGAAPETQFANATASSVGDPHLSLDGTTSSGAAVNDTWDSMHAHGDLLDSDSFGGGYRIATQVTAPNAKGKTLNASATIATSSGATTVSMQADGSYSVDANGAPVTLRQGYATSLGNGETVTLNADGSLTVNDANANGGSIATTLKSNGDGGVDVTAKASDVDLGGYLVTHGDPAPALAPPPPEPFSGYPQLALAQTQPLSNFEQFDPDAAETSLQTIER